MQLPFTLPGYSPAKVATLADPLTTPDGAVWSGYGGYATAANGSMQITPPSATEIDVISVTKYTLTASNISVRILDYNNIGSVLNYAGLGVIDSAGNQYSLLVKSTSATTPPNLVAQKTIGGTTTAIGTAGAWERLFDQYIRIRESAGTIYFEACADGATWVTIQSQAKNASFDATAVQVVLFAYSNTTGMRAYFDRINTAAPAATGIDLYRNTFTVDPDLSLAVDYFTEWAYWDLPTNGITANGGVLTVVLDGSVVNGEMDAVVRDPLVLTGKSVFVKMSGFDSSIGYYSTTLLIYDSTNSASYVFFGIIWDATVSQPVLTTDQVYLGTTTPATGYPTEIYNPVTMAFLRIRESAGTIFFEYSADAKTWTNHFSVTNPGWNTGAVLLDVIDAYNPTALAAGHNPIIKASSLNIIPGTAPRGKLVSVPMAVKRAANW